MAIGDAAVAAGMAVLDGSELANTLDTEVNRTRDYIAQRTSAVTPISKGGTNATSASAARTNLDVPSNADLATKANVSHFHQTLNAGVGKSFGWNATVVAGGVWNTGNDVRVAGVLLLPTAGPATSSPVLAYIQSDGRVCKGTSSIRYKENVKDAPVLGDIFPTLREYQMKDGDGKKLIGYIAEELVGTPAERFVVYDGEQVESIDFIGLLLGQVAQLQKRLAALEAK